MMNGQDNLNWINLGTFLTGLTLVGTLLFPAFEFSSSAPKFEISDLTFPFLLGISLVAFRAELFRFYTTNKPVLVLLLLALIAVFSILINGRYLEYRDWFEPLKFFKLFCFVFFFYHFTGKSNVQKLFRYSFVILVFFNLLHYLDAFEFNRIIEPFYAPPHHLDFFGLNSIGLPATKRMLGTLGNPNNNAILFVLCLIFFLPRKQDSKSSMILSSLAVIGVIACQSRTGVICLFLVLVLYFIFYKPGRLTVITLSSVFLVCFFAFGYAGNTYLASLGDAGYLREAKIGRLEQWNRIIESMPGYWIMGHGVNKEFFEARGIYAESEYFLALYRYGIAGVLCVMLYWLLLAKKHIQEALSSHGLNLFGCIAVFAVSGITNSPLHVVKLSVLMTFLVGFSLRNMTYGK
jgi:hypothetical protein